MSEKYRDYAVTVLNNLVELCLIRYVITCCQNAHHPLAWNLYHDEVREDFLGSPRIHLTPVAVMIRSEEKILRNQKHHIYLHIIP